MLDRHISTLPIDQDRLMQIDRLLSYEETLDDLYHVLYRLRDKMYESHLDLYRNIQYEIGRSIELISQAHDIVYNHNINLNLTYEKQD